MSGKEISVRNPVEVVISSSEYCKFQIEKVFASGAAIAVAFFSIDAGLEATMDPLLSFVPAVAAATFGRFYVDHVKYLNAVHKELGLPKGTITSMKSGPLYFERKNGVTTRLPHVANANGGDVYRFTDIALVKLQKTNPIAEWDKNLENVETIYPMAENHKKRLLAEAITASRSGT